MNYDAFKLGFWHPFGPHGRETAEQIIVRKRKEIEDNDGWTLWSFQYRRSETLDEWYERLRANSGESPVVFCSHSPKAKDPANVGVPVNPIDCQSYRFVGQENWQPLPPRVSVRHPFRVQRKQASAFVVKNIVIVPERNTQPCPAVEWLYIAERQCTAERQWRQDQVPTRGEYLIRLGGTRPRRPISAVLELRDPYLAVVSADMV
jgi:hypothetical protein